LKFSDVNWKKSLYETEEKEKAWIGQGIGLKWMNHQRIMFEPQLTQNSVMTRRKRDRKYTTQKIASIPLGAIFESPVQSRRTNFGDVEILG